MKNLTCLLFLCALGVQAQTIKGRTSVPGAVVSLFHDSLIVKTGVTQADGNFSLSATSGTYYLTVRSVGYQVYRSTAFRLVRDTNLSIDLLPITRELKTVTVTTARPMIEVQPDKTVFNVQNSLSATGTNGFELLRKAPGVVIDNQDNLVVEGKSGISIYIDGRRSLLSGTDLVNFLKSLQASDVEAVEIITQPSSKYDAAGNAGIINLRLKKNKNYGTNGSLATGYAKGIWSKSNTALSLNNRTAKANIYGTYSNLLGKNQGFINLYRIQSGTIYDAHSVNVSADYSHNLRAGLDYTINRQKSFGVVIGGTFSGYDNNTVSRTPIINQSGGQTQQVLSATGQTLSTNRNLSTNLNYRFADTSGHEFTLDGDVAYYSSGRNNLQPNAYYNAAETQVLSQSVFRMLTPVNIYLFSLKTDLAARWGKGKLTYGLKSSLVKTDNTFQFYNVEGSTEALNATRSNAFGYRENINAGYFNYSRDWKKLSLQLGVRAEQTISDGELSSSQVLADNRVKRNYLDIFPSGGLTYKADAKNSLGLLYSRRVERPSYRSLNPFESNIDELSFSKGNPFLQPQYTHNVKLSHTYQYTLTTSLSYSYITNFFAQITDTASNNRNFISPQNIANQQVIDLGVSYPFSINQWWSVYASLNAYRSSYQSRNAKFMAVTQNTLSFYGQNSITLPKKFSLEISGWFSSPTVWGGTYRTRSMGSMDIAVQKQFGRLSARLAATDILYTSNWSGDTQYGVIFIRGNGGYESRQLKVNLSYSFGRNEIKAARKRASAVEDEKGRITN